ncbi:MAG: peptidoglycan bridge formation glycyltransferase FemA/FemB family protein [bacterium]|nr:peptidoglycan bridge formation glycyltransferase FemA/FemB family protein [bacterium]
MRFIPLGPSLREEWDKIVYNSDDAWMFHLYDWITLIERIPEWNLAPENFLVEHEGKIVAIFPLQMRSHTKELLSTGMGPAGHAIRNDVKHKDRENILKETYEYIKNIAYKKKASKISIFIPPLNETSLNNHRGVNPLVNYFYLDVSTHTWIIDLSKTKTELYDNISRNARREIKEAIDKGYRVREINSREEIDIYYNIHCHTYERTGVMPHPKAYFLGIYDYFILNGRTKGFVAIDKNNEPIGFTNIAIFKEKAVYFTTCCEDEHFKNGVYYLLLWNAIEYAKDNGLKWFDCAEAFPNVKEGKLKGLNDFKSKFGGELHRFYKGDMIFVPDDKLENKPEEWEALKEWVKYTKLLIKRISVKRMLR